ncbi:HAMP domain-containing histidine kinase [Streptomyces sp. S.PNR 29]|nr:HAMP domain-containing sensor histidine kinase [Streptomyces sp. S.PNR 29]MDN0195733.1 HAMP domain-containing histidine kinase [Streptomyces sp. S.PNR 29]
MPQVQPDRGEDAEPQHQGRAPPGTSRVPEGIRPGVFEPFTRADRHTKDVGGGAGLGLSIVAAVAQAHGGSVSLRSAPGSTTFAVRLPRAVE